MLNLSSWAFEQKRLILSVSLIFILVGLVAMFTMAREEDPKLADRFGTLTIVFPGADPLSFERTVIAPIEDELKTIEEIKKLQTTIRSDFSVTEIELRDSTEDIEKAWNEIRSRIENIKSDFPALVKYHLNRTQKVEGILLALSVAEPLQSLDLARELKDTILAVSGVSRVNLHGAPEEEIQVQISPQKISDLGISFGQVLNAIRKSNTSLPGGLLVQQNQNILLTPNSRLESIEHIQQVAIPLETGEVVRMKEIAQIQRGLKNPPQSLARLDGNEVYVLGVALSHPSDVIQVGARVREVVKSFEDTHSTKIHEITFQPDRTKSRLSDLFQSLLTGVLSVGILLSLWAGWRVGLVVAMSVPAITLIGLAAYFMGGGVLHQISLAAFVLSLGQFIDNIIVIVESIQRKVNEGQNNILAAKETMKEFSRPMIFATGTGAAAFVPMLASTGSTAEFTFAIPLIAILTLVISYFFAILVAPVLSSWVLKKSKNKSEQRSEKLANWISLLVIHRPGRIVFAAFTLLVICAAGFPIVKKQFFPEGDRNELLVRIETLEGSSFKSTNLVAKKVEEIISKDEAVKYAASFIGQGTPFFYYNLAGVLQNPTFSEILVVTHDLVQNKEFAQRIESWASQNISTARVKVLALEQGPPIKAPIEIRVVGKDLDKLEKTAKQILNDLKLQSGLREAHMSSGQKISSTAISLNDVEAAKYGVQREELAWTTLATTSGVEATQYFGGKETVPLRVSFSSDQDLSSMPLAAAESRTVRAGDVARFEETKIPATIQRIGGERMISILGYLHPNTGYNEVMNPIVTMIQQNKFSSLGVRVEIGGQAEGSEEANLAIFRAIPLGFILLLTCLLLQFNSFSKIFIIFISLPLAITGIVPGLLLGEAPFGFMSLLGLLALIGIVVNNAILLLETLENCIQQEGLSLESAIHKTLELRLQPILLTALLTVAGLLPLAFESSTLWPPLAWTMISGLIAATFLTLAVLPALYYLMMKSQSRVDKKVLASVFMLFGLLLNTQSGEAKTYSLQELWIEGGKSFSVEAKKSEFEAATHEEKIKKRQAYFPQVNAFAESKFIDRKLYAPSFFGPVESGKQTQFQSGLEITQSLFNYSQMGPEIEAVKARTQAKSLETQRHKIKTQTEVLKMGLLFLQLQEDQKIMSDFVKNLNQQKTEVARFFSEGRASRADFTKVRIELSGAESGLEELKQAEGDLLQSLRIYVPDFENILVDSFPQLLTEKISIGSSASDAHSNRSDLLALEKSIEAQTSMIKAVRGGHLPVLNAYGRALHVDQGQLIDKNWYEVGVRITIPLFEGGTRVSQTQAEVLRAQSYRQHHQETVKKIESEIEIARRNWLQMETNLQRTEKDLKIAQQMIFEERRRFKKGRVSLSDLLEAERLFLQQQRLSIVYKYGKMQAALASFLALEKDFNFEEK